MYDIGMSFPPSLRLSGPSCVCFCVVSWIPPLCRGLAILSCTDTACERSADNTRSARTCFGSHCIYLHAKLVFVTAACRDTLKRSDEDGLQPAAFARLRVVYFPSRRSLPVVPFHRSHENASPFCADVSGHHFSWQPQLSHLPYRSNPTRIPMFVLTQSICLTTFWQTSEGSFSGGRTFSLELGKLLTRSSRFTCLFTF